MDPIQFAIANPVKTAVGVILVLLFGGIALARIPVQLTPDVDRPVITVRTNWSGRSPEEIEKSIIIEQEEKLKSVQGLWKMTSLASLGTAQITLEFNVGASPERILQEVSNKIDEVPEYPEDVDRPIIDVADTAGDDAIAYLLLQAEDPEFEVATFYDYADRFMKPSLERIEGVAEIDIKGGRAHEVQVRFDPTALAKRSITISELNSALRLDNVNASAGDLANDRQDVRFRVLGQYDSLQPLRDTIIKYDDMGSPVRVSDVAIVELALEKITHFDQCKGRTSMTIFVKRKTGSNVLDIVENVERVVGEMNAEGGVLRSFKNDRYGLRLRMAFDDSLYIYSAIGLVRRNLWIGGGLAVLVLLLFLRSVRSTLIIAASIPISVIGTFVVMWFADRNLNVISLAGLSFAVGMVVDNAIVVLENIDRHLKLGASPARAAYDGTREVWGAILASTLTTIAVFAPVLTVQDEAGQLFYDLILAICAAVALSFIVSITVIPTAASLFLRPTKAHSRFTAPFYSLFGLANVFGWLSERWAALIHLLTFRSVSSAWLRIMLVGITVVASILLSLMLMPAASYLPNGNKNFTFCRMSTPAGYSVMENFYVGQRIEKELKPFWNAKDSQEASQHGPVVDVRSGKEYFDIPALKEFFFVVARGSVFVIGISQDANNVEPVAAVFNKAFDVIPASKGVTSQASIFGRGSGSSNAVDLEVSGNDLVRLKMACTYLEKQLQEAFSKFSVRSSPGNFNEAGPELQIQIKQEVAKRLNINVSELALSARSMIDGSFVGDFDFEGDNIDLVLLRDPAFEVSPEEIPELPIAVREANGDVVMIPLGQVADFVSTEASQEIRRVEQQRAISLTVTPPNNIALEQAQETILDIVAQAREEGRLGNDLFVSLSGNADRLSEVRTTLMGRWSGWNWESIGSVALSRFFLALVITYLLMTALFENFLYPLVIMFTVPLATVGGFIGLWLVHRHDPTQQLDVLTMLGFVILVGVVVNNAILIVHQALNYMRGHHSEAEGDVAPMSPRDAIRESVRTRMRPIFMTTCTSVFGMLPLVIAPGSGSELYRGLGSIVVGGLAFSTVFTLLVIPLLFSLSLDVFSFWKREPNDPIVTEWTWRAMFSKTEKTIFFDALDIDLASDRDAFVAEACGDDGQLLASVNDLLRENDREVNPIDRPLAAPFMPTQIIGGSDELTDPRFVPGTMVGPYKLMEQIGEGGFGLVFVADQQKPVRRRVALKIIKPGMDSRDVLARFEAERQALAMMDHENIARVFDAGVTETGQPYFVMELVRGVPLNEFCDKQRLAARNRLDLFLAICNAVQHAHQKGIIHRDLKPANVLVTVQDGRPIAKVIDFGLVKAVSQSLTDKTIYTRFASMMGTPAYMSPEQAEMSNVDVDTRSDIYALGVILYELLTGSTPLEAERLRRVGFDELRRIIREEEPQQPSLRFSTLDRHIATTVSANRQLEPSELASMMKGDIDWIVMKALDKDRNRRYPSAAAFGADIQRFLDDMPVEARPPSALYRFKKFARRNKVVFATASLVAAALILGTAISVWQAKIAYDALEQARESETEAKTSRLELKDFADRLQQANALLTSGRAFVEAGNLSAAHDAYNQATQVQPRYFHVWMERGLLYARLGLWDRAASDFSQAIELGCPVDRAEFIGVAQLFFYTGDEATYRRLAKALAVRDSGYLVTRFGSLLIEPVTEDLAKQLAEEAEQTIDDRGQLALAVPKKSARVPRGAKLYHSGWANLQAGNLDVAIKRLEQSNHDDPYWGGLGIGDPLLAIAYHKNGREIDAQEALDRAAKSLSDWLDQSIAKRHGAPPIPWFDWLEFLINYRQASILITGEAPDTDPRLAEVKAIATAAIK